MARVTTKTRAQLLTILDLAATFLFGIEGARAGAEANVDVLGLMVLAFATALGGGVARDVLIGDVPPAALRSIAYPLTAFAGGAVVLFLYRAVEELPSSVTDALDAGGLSLFCVVGAAKALDHGLNRLIAVLLGTMTAVGGGVIRDVLLREVPHVLQTDVYPAAPLLGATTVVVASALGVARAPAMVAGAATCFALRMTSVWLDWDLPTAVGR